MRSTRASAATLLAAVSLFAPATATYGGGLCSFKDYAWQSPSYTNGKSWNWGNMHGNKWWSLPMGQMSSFHGFQNGWNNVGSSSQCAQKCLGLGSFGYSWGNDGSCAVANSGNTVVPKPGCSVGYKWTCAHNQYMDRWGKCNQCPSGHTCHSSGQSCVPCPSGQSIDRKWGSPTYGQCTCSSGSYSCASTLHNAGCDCQLTESVLLAGNKCVNCPSGAVVNTAGTGCVCPARQVLNNAGTACVPIQTCCSGSSLNSDGNCVCSADGQYYNSGTCVACNGVTSVVNGVQQCIPCAPGTSLNADKTQCYCPVGQWYNGQCQTCNGVVTTTLSSPGYQQTCTPCPSGQIPNNDASACIPACPPNSCQVNGQCICTTSGQYLSGEKCLTCDNGIVSISGGQQICTTCPSGQVPSPDKTKCVTDCPAGSSPNSQGQCVCTAPGTYLCSAGTCIECKNGIIYINSQGYQTCAVCPTPLVVNDSYTNCVCPPGSNLKNGQCICDSTSQPATSSGCPCGGSYNGGMCKTKRA